MKTFIYIALLILGAYPLKANKELQTEKIERAEKAYKSKKYKEAVQSYEDLLKQGFVSDKLYYNLGNAYYKDNQLGKAIYNYELAHELNPSDEDIKVNLAIANDKTIDKIDTKTNLFAGVLKAKLVHGISTTGWAWASIIAFAAALLMIYMFVASPVMLLKRIGFFAGILCVIGFVISMVFGFISLRDKKQTQFAIILAKECKIYNEPQEDDKQKFSLHEGTRLKVMETNTEWTSVKLENGNEGWVKTDAIGLF
ncbi:MAG: tetratricopeptide repeat protein [Bacteroidetes bacterium]|nr:tetratricopeptide repeat protein [Bacteroidota bacterium]